MSLADIAFTTSLKPGVVAVSLLWADCMQTWAWGLTPPTLWRSLRMILLRIMKRAAALLDWLCLDSLHMLGSRKQPDKQVLPCTLGQAVLAFALRLAA